MTSILKQMAILGAAVLMSWPAVAQKTAPAEDKATTTIAPGAPGAEERMGGVYVLMTKGEKSRQEGNPNLARDSYEEALEILEALETDYPGWYTQVVRQRILACESAIEQIKNGKPAPPVSGLDSPSGKAVNPLADLDFPLSSESTETALQALRAGIDERDMTVSDLRAEIRELKDQNRKLAARLVAFEGKKTKADPGNPALIYPDVLKEEVRQRIEAGSYSNAVALLDEMKEMLPEDSGIPRLLGVVYCRQGSFDLAIQVIEPLIKRGRAPADVWVTLGVAYLGTGNLGRARNAFEKALDRDASLSEAHFNLAQILIRLKPPDADLARRHYMMALQQGASRDSNLESVINQALLDGQARKLKR
jgi:tetratricopeptide (TPR) repeat protein